MDGDDPPVPDQLTNNPLTKITSGITYVILGIFLLFVIGILVSTLVVFYLAGGV